MARVLVPDAGPVVVDRLQGWARRWGRSLEVRVRSILNRAVDVDRQDLLDHLRSILAGLGDLTFSDSTEFPSVDHER
jgi:hypothetical protein